VIRRHWGLTCGFVVVFAMAAFAASFLLQPSYMAEALVLPIGGEMDANAGDAIRGQLGGLAALTGLSIGNGSNRDEVIAELRSRGFTQEFIDELGVMQSMYAKQWDAKTSTWRPSWRGKTPTMWDAIKRFDGSVREVEEDKLTGLVTVRVYWGNPDVAATWANALIERLNQRARRRAIAEATQSLEYLNRELARTNILEMRQLLYRLVEQQTQKITMANVREQFALRVIDPAKAPDADDFAFPKRPLFAVIGAALGAILGVVFLMWRLGRSSTALIAGNAHS
jgi:uncharacterized protein involved in exopolysaccharide biosynthesis